MARHRDLDECMFCDTLPCTCNPKTKKAAKPRKKAASSAPEAQHPAPAGQGSSVTPVQPSTTDQPPMSSPPSLDKAALHAAMRAEIKPLPASTFSSSAVPPVTSRSTTVEAIREAAKQTDDDADDLTRAIGALAPILHPEEKERFAEQLASPLARAVQWRAGLSGEVRDHG